MSTVKTAVSLPPAVFKQGEALARRLRISRSRLFALALEDYIQRCSNQELLERLNAAHSGLPEVSESRLRAAMRREHRRVLEGEW